jgi:phosphatidylserine/phosphatidylglycerophosphate/cardiolipin synthase-like enzyme
MTLLTLPDDGVAPLLKAIASARKLIQIAIFRFDFPEVERALEAAVGRGVQVHALIAHTNRAGEKLLRKLELRLLGAGMTVTRTSDELARYHGKFLVVDEKVLYVLACNFTRLDIQRSRSFGLVIRNARLLKEAAALLEADTTRQPFTPRVADLVVSPQSSRERLSRFIKAARRELLIYDPKVTDRAMVRLLRDRVDAGVRIRMLGKIVVQAEGLTTARLQGLRLHCRAMLRDGAELFVGSQSLRQVELDERREVGVIVRNRSLAKKFTDTFERDWAEAATREGAETSEEPQADARESRAAG